MCHCDLPIKGIIDYITIIIIAQFQFTSRVWFTICAFPSFSLPVRAPKSLSTTPYIEKCQCLKFKLLFKYGLFLFVCVRGQFTPQ